MEMKLQFNEASHLVISILGMNGRNTNMKLMLHYLNIILMSALKNSSTKMPILKQSLQACQWFVLNIVIKGKFKITI
jgi:hypothetical protein